MPMSDATLHDLYPPIEPYQHGFLPEKDGHTVYFENISTKLSCPQSPPHFFVYFLAISACLKEEAINVIIYRRRIAFRSMERWYVFVEVKFVILGTADLSLS